jgi:transcriptional regulator with XRE-family HTH domain
MARFAALWPYVCYLPREKMKQKHTFGRALLAVRLARNMPQDALGLAQSNISRLENGAKAPSWARVEELADLLHVHPLTLFTLAYTSQTDDEDLLRKVRKELDELKTR